MPIKVIKVTGGDKYKALLAKIAAQKVGVKAGIFDNATTTEVRYDGKKKKNLVWTPAGKSIAEYAIYNEFGTADIPARPFMRQTVEKHQKEWCEQIGQFLKGQPDNAKGAMMFIGEVMRADIVDEIEHGDFKELNDKTKERKALLKSNDADKPLVATGQMEHAVAYEVVTK